MEKLIELFKSKILISGIFSNPRKKEGPKKITIRPVVIKDNPLFQVETFQDNKAFHQNVTKSELIDLVSQNYKHFKQLQLYTDESDFSILINKKGDTTIKKVAATKKMATNITHNKEKKYILNDATSKEFFIILGIMDQNGEIKPSKYDKFKQINKYIEIIDNVIDELNLTFYRIIDFGCGKSYLTFALYHFLKNIKQKDVEIIGLDLKEDVITLCNQLSAKLGYTDLKFQIGDIGNFILEGQIDLVISLHACNTATDLAIYKGILWKSKAILAVPCCHHEAYTQINNETLDPIFKHGILKEKIASLITDGLRGNLLEVFSYKVSIIEFIDSTHTPKNILIKAILSKSECINKEALNEYTAISSMLGLNLTLAKLLEDNLNKEG
ncbi:MAG: SAM-dependent methyltransferase [Candidatus Epulonipiscioides saccharophilum]|nr:MAG: SAM-dependent methyltransferase [Epulopiscium sp. AS2M-Bin001]